MSRRSIAMGDVTALATHPVGRLLLVYSAPAVVGMVVNSLYNIIDRIFIGQGVGPEAISGLAITFPVMNISAAIGVLVGAGSAARVSIMLGARDKHGAEKVLGNALVLTLINAFIYITFFAVYMEEILRLFGASDATLPYAYEFMMNLLPGLLVMNLTFSFNNVMRASGYPVRAMVTMFIGAGVNLVLAPIFIFGLDMGIRGAAIATDIAMTVTAIFVMGHFFLPSSQLHFKRGIYRLEWRIIAGIVGIGAAPSIVNIASCAINGIINNTLYRLGGDMAVGAMGIFTTYTSLLCMVVVGICQGMQPVVGYNYGASLLDRSRRTFYIACAAATLIVTIGAILGMTCPGLIARAFTTDTTLISVTSHAFTTAMMAFWMVGFQIVATTLFQSIGKAGTSIFLSLTRQVIFLIPLLILLPDLLGLQGVWLSFPLSDILATLVTLWLVLRQLRTFSRPHPLRP